MNVYKNELDDTVRFRIEPRIGQDGIYLELKENGNRATTVFPPKDAPALALAILEAAFASSQPAPDKIGEAYAALYSWQCDQESEAAAAREQAELEAEALELYNACMGHNLTSWAGMGGKLRDQWLAVARKAREMRAEK